MVRPKRTPLPSQKVMSKKVLPSAAPMQPAMETPVTTKMLKLSSHHRIAIASSSSLPSLIDPLATPPPSPLPLLLDLDEAVGAAVRRGAEAHLMTQPALLDEEVGLIASVFSKLLFLNH